jgi:hypothetical protein
LLLNELNNAYHGIWSRVRFRKAKKYSHPRELFERELNKLIESGKDPDVWTFYQEFGQISLRSCVYFAPEGTYRNPRNRQEVRQISTQIQRGQSADIPMKIMYVFRDDGNNPRKVTARNFNAVDYLLPLNATKNLSNDEFMKIHGEFQLSGKRSNQFFYNTAKLASFPDVADNSVIELNDREKKSVKVKVSIPSDFPDELVGRARIPIFAGAEVEPWTVQFNVANIDIMVTAV